MSLVPPTLLPLHRFSDWSSADVPAVAAGVFAIWKDETLIYAGMSGREPESPLFTHSPRSSHDSR